MKTIVVLAVSIVLVGILFCPMAMSAPSMPADLQIVQPDPSLPKELSAFFGKWEGSDSYMEYFLIVEKIDERKASLYFWQSDPPYGSPSWMRYEAQVIKEGLKYKLGYQIHTGDVELTLKGEELNWYAGGFAKTNIRFKRVP